MTLEQQTRQLVEQLDHLKTIYEANSPPESKQDRAFFKKVKERTSPIYTLLAEWEENALQAVKKRQINMHPQQISSTRENMELLMLNSYYIDVRRKQYMEFHHSIQFILDQLLDELHQA